VENKKCTPDLGVKREKMLREGEMEQKLGKYNSFRQENEPKDGEKWRDKGVDRCSYQKRVGRMA